MKKEAMNRINILISILNLIVLMSFWYRHSSPILHSVASFSNADFLAAQANHNALLQVHLVIFTILFAFLGFLGYNKIKKSAERIAEERVEQKLNVLVPKLVKGHIENLGPERIAQMLMELKMATPAKKDEEELSEIRVEEVVDGLEEK